MSDKELHSIANPILIDNITETSNLEKQQDGSKIVIYKRRFHKKQIKHSKIRKIKTYKEEKEKNPVQINLTNALTVLNGFVDAYEEKSKPNVQRPLKLKKNKKIKSNRQQLNQPLVSRDVTDLLLDTRDNSGILIGPQNASEVNLSNSIEWPSTISNVNDALDMLRYWSTSISTDVNNIKSDLSDISSNIENALEDITGYNNIETSAKIHVLRERVNNLQDLIRNLYNKF